MASEEKFKTCRPVGRQTKLISWSYDSKKYFDLESRVDEILYYLWDPIGVNDEPFARSEYHNYVNTICSLVRDNHDPNIIAAKLDEIARNPMGLVPTGNHSLEIAEILLKAKSAINQKLS